MMKSSFDILYDKYRTISEEILTDLFPDDYFRTNLPSVLEESMRYSLFSGGKRLRPVLILSAHETLGGDDEAVRYLAAAIEMIHTYSLIHDDLPCMDDDTLRRGKPTNHIVFGYPMAVLAGDGLLNLAYEVLLSGAFVSKNTERYLLAAKTLAVSAGMKGMVGGQAADILWEGSDPNEEKIHVIHQNKTGAIICASILSGAILATEDEQILYAMKKYGQIIGEMFQVVDDILDITGSAEDLGKSINKDQQQNKMTYPYVYGLENSKIKVEELADAAKNAISHLENVEFLHSLIDYLKNRTK